MPSIRANKREKNPAPNPLNLAIAIGSLAEIFLVKLLSIPQRAQAKRTPIAPMDKPNLPLKSRESIMLAKVTEIIASQILLLTDSLKAK